MSEVVGQHTAETGSSRSPADIYHIADDVRLHRLRPATGDLYPVPIVLVPSLLSKWYVFDLHPARTMAGFAQVTVLGYSLGGVMSTVFTALYPDRVRNLITLTTPIDFHRTGLTAIWARYFPINPFVDFWGNIPGWWLRGAFTLAAGPRRIALMRTLRGDMDTQEGRAVVNEVRKWIRDGVPVAGEMYRTLVHDCYKHNMLIRQSLPIGGRTVDLGDIESALLTITASEDHLCPPKSAEALNRAVASEDETAISVPGGHLGAVIGPKAHHLLWTRIDDWLSERSGHHPADWYGGQP
jgi:polyhydroxyalkanoate synthase